MGCAREGVTGIAQAQDEQPDLILIDMGQPQLDGWETARHLKAGPATAQSPVLAITTNLTPEAVAACMAVGCAGLFANPFAIDDVLDQIEAALAVDPTREQERVAGQRLR